MNGERFTNARVHEWLTPGLDTVTKAMHTTRLQLNSAALWWFLNRLTPKERAEILGEYVKALALRHEKQKPARPTKPTRQRPRRKPPSRG
ncbi:MAG TPA: hypothetical protein VKA46_04020 [Gemmataceae bacterium]|nr:hypothetical protein [Gemmataceae bacterium]